MNGQQYLVIVWPFLVSAVTAFSDFWPAPGLDRLQRKRLPPLGGQFSAVKNRGSSGKSFCSVNWCRSLTSG
jgi:hypothetical protein